MTCRVCLDQAACDGAGPPGCWHREGLTDEQVFNIFMAAGPLDRLVMMGACTRTGPAELRGGDAAPEGGGLSCPGPTGNLPNLAGGRESAGSFPNQEGDNMADPNNPVLAKLSAIEASIADAAAELRNQNPADTNRADIAGTLLQAGDLVNTASNAIVATCPNVNI